MLNLEQAVSYHLQGNFYPALPQAYVAPALEAIEWVRQGEFDVIIFLPENLNPLPRQAKQHNGVWYVTSSDLFDVLRLGDHKFGDLVAEY
jgi:hypothetical protein